MVILYALLLLVPLFPQKVFASVIDRHSVPISITVSVVEAPPSPKIEPVIVDLGTVSSLFVHPHFWQVAIPISLFGSIDNTAQQFEIFFDSDTEQRVTQVAWGKEHLFIELPSFNEDQRLTLKQGDTQFALTVTKPEKSTLLRIVCDQENFCFWEVVSDTLISQIDVLQITTEINGDDVTSNTPTLFPTAVDHFKQLAPSSLDTHSIYIEATVQYVDGSKEVLFTQTPEDQ